MYSMDKTRLITKLEKYQQVKKNEEGKNNWCKR